MPYAHSDSDIADLDILGKNSLECGLKFLVVILMNAVDKEYVCACTTGNRIQCRQDLLQVVADFCQNLVTDSEPMSSGIICFRYSKK